MSHPVQEMRDESVGQWLPLIEFSIRSGVSLSTIRRKIKSKSIPFRLEKGKYLVLFTGNPSSWDGMADLPTSTTTNPVNMDSSSLKEAQATIHQQKIRIQELEQEIEELSFLLQALEQKYKIKY